MLELLHLKNFKAFQELEIEIRALTVLTGLNSAGKSTVIQSLLLAHLASDYADIPLNGVYGLSLGEALDVLYAKAEEPVIEVAIRRNGKTHLTRMDVPDDRSLTLKRSQGAPVAIVNDYLSAERLGPRDLLEVSSGQGNRLSVGHRGEFTAHVLAHHERQQVPEALRLKHEEDDAITVGRQVELWMQEIVGPIQIQATWLSGTNSATLRFRRPDALTDWLRPPNVGFGVTYVLPIIVACLTSSPGDTIIVENPEAHLHPAAQSTLGRFLGRLPSCGVQVIVETHSDHIVNGIRLAVGYDKTLEARNLVVHYFDGAGRVYNIKAQPNATLSDWPRGFFDQAEHDLFLLSRIPKRG